jgi:hypothetical protein
MTSADVMAITKWSISGSEKTPRLDLDDAPSFPRDASAGLSRMIADLRHIELSPDRFRDFWARLA